MIHASRPRGRANFHTMISIGTLRVGASTLSFACRCRTCDRGASAAARCRFAPRDAGANCGDCRTRRRGRDVCDETAPVEIERRAGISIGSHYAIGSGIKNHTPNASGTPMTAPAIAPMIGL
jgi:hypothetical protein